MIRLSNISKALQGPDDVLAILDGIDLFVDRNEIVLMRGRSGSGKSTLLFLLGLLDRPTHGSYTLDGIETNELGDRAFDALRSTHVGYLFQNFYLMPRLTAWENVLLPLDHANREDRRDAAGWARELVERLEIDHRLEHLPAEMSGGEQQRVGIARALVRRPTVLLADEPTGSLDEGTGKTIADLITSVARDLGITAVVASHDSALFSESCDREVVVSDGGLQETLVR